MGVKTYDASQVQVILGAVPLVGAADGQFCNVTWDEDDYGKTTGADGEVSRHRMNNDSSTVTLTLLQTSDTNDLLMGYALADRTNNSGVFSLMIKDMNGRSLFVTDSAWVQRKPDMTFSKETETREWTIATGRATVFIGGNA